MTFGQRFDGRLVTDSLDQDHGVRVTHEPSLALNAGQVHPLLCAGRSPAADHDDFVRVADGIEGLVHLSELAAPTVDGSGNAVRVGDEVTVIVIEVDSLQRRVALSRRRAAEPPSHRATEPPSHRARLGDPCDPAG
ncbi:S1 RNA-binding domain-containing protein [Nonomuraea sp. NPDC050451]|uniref:S1 RNA-binding domain-containing protein n=1 Tax=Nonomuraea sp. NPDC050451 TaxID=3364364 RepID=UPI0037B7FE18